MRLVLSAAPLAAAVVVACAAGRDVTPQIQVTPGAAARIGLIGSRAGRPPRAGREGAARVHPLRAGEELGGPNATGKPGDWVLENEEVVFVIDGLGAGSGFAESGGNLIDAADARARKDELGQIFTYFGEFPRQAVYAAIEAQTEPDGTAVVEARGRELLDEAVEVRTEYRLRGGDRALLVRTTLTNRGAARVSGLGLGDALQWGGAEKIAPGKPRGFKGPSQGPFLGGIGRFASYAITSTDGEIGAISGGAWSDTVQRKDVAIEPGASVTYERVVVVGERPDAASLVSELTKTSGGEVGAVEIALVDASGRPVTASAGSKVVLGTASADEVLSVVATADGATFGGEVPPGRWVIGYAPSAGRRARGDKKSVEVKKGAVARVTLEVSDASSTTLGPCLEEGADGARPVPCRLVVEGLAGTPTPDFGPGHVAGPAKDQILLGPGALATVPLPHGRYRVTAARGPEYALDVREIDVPGAATAGAPPPFRLRRVVDTAGYVATDFHQHTSLSADSGVSARDRLLANVAEGVEIAVASEHNAIVDLGPIARELGLAPFLVSIPGDEITTDASKKPWGHANVFPLDPAPERPRGGAFAARDRSPREVFAEARALGGARVVQVNHPRSGKNGYFDQLGFDARTGAATSPEYAADFDALEVWNGRNVDARARVLEDYFGLLRGGRPVTPIADTDTHGIVGQEAGYPRTYVRVADDRGLEAWDAGRTADLVRAVRERRDVVLTNGPFVEVRAGGVGIGGVARARGGAVEVEVRVLSAPFVEVDRIEVRRLSGATLATPGDARLDVVRGEGKATEARARFRVRASKDDAIVVVARGSRPMRPLLAGDDAEIAPWAMTGAIWIDADGDGRALGRSSAP